MKTTTYKIRMRDDSEQEVQGIVVNGVWGIDKRTTTKTTYTANGEEKKSNSSDFFLTHIPTGTLVTNARTRKALMEIANLEDLMDEEDLGAIAKAVVKYWNAKGWKD